MYIHVCIVHYIQTIYLAACSKKLFAETKNCLLWTERNCLLWTERNCLLRRVAVELCYGQRREVEL